jgi:hypothetical protein
VEVKFSPNTVITNPVDPALALEGERLEMVCPNAELANNSPDKIQQKKNERRSWCIHDSSCL